MKNIFIHKILRLLLINILVFVAVIVFVETFFYIALSLKLLTPRSGLNPTTHYRTTAEVIAQYGQEAFKINPRFDSSHMYDWNLQGSMLKDKIDPRYYSDYSKNQTQLKTYRMVRYAADNDTPVPIYDVNYTYDELGLRRNLVKFKDSKPKKFVAALGCSYTIGTGVADGLDYPSQLAEKISSDYRVFNYGFHGFGFNDLYARTLEFPEAYNPPSTDEGVVLWLFIPDHLQRFFCHFQCVRHNLTWINLKPRLVEKNGELVVAGQIGDASLQNALWKVLARSSLLMYLNIDIPSEYSKEELHTVAHTYAEIAYNRIKPGARKRVYLINLSQFSQKEELFNEMRSFGIQVLDYSDIPFQKFSHHLRIPVDSHPTPEYYEMIANLIHHDVFAK